MLATVSELWLQIHTTLQVSVQCYVGSAISYAINKKKGYCVSKKMTVA